MHLDCMSQCDFESYINVVLKFAVSFTPHHLLLISSLTLCLYLFHPSLCTFFPSLPPAFHAAQSLNSFVFFPLTRWLQKEGRNGRREGTEGWKEKKS